MRLPSGMTSFRGIADLAGIRGIRQAKFLQVNFPVQAGVAAGMATLQISGLDRWVTSFAVRPVTPANLNV